MSLTPEGLCLGGLVCLSDLRVSPGGVPTTGGCIGRAQSRRRLGGRVTLISLASVTRNNMNQRFMDLDCVTPTGAPGAFQISAPKDSSIAPPGDFMLFVISKSGVPSVGEYVRGGT